MSVTATDIEASANNSDVDTGPVRHSTLRTVIRATFITCSPLAIHCGLSTDDLKALGLMDREQFFRECNQWNEGVEDCDALIMRDWKNRPYIPGSSLKGVVREWLTRPQNYRQYRKTIDWMLGTPSEDGDEGAGGAVVFEDAFLVSDSIPDSSTFSHLPFYDHSQLTFVEQHTSIDRRTGAVHHTGLYNTEAVPAGITFRVQLIVDDAPMDAHVHEQAVDLLKQAMAAFNHPVENTPPQLGSDTRNGWGLMSCIDLKTSRWVPSSGFPSQDAGQNVTNIEAPAAVRRRRVSLKLNLILDSLFLTCDPAKSLLTARHGNSDVFDAGLNEVLVGQKSLPKVDQTPRLAGPWNIEASGDEYQITARALLPAASFKGPYRSQVEKILRTIHPNIAVSPHGQLQALTERSPEFVKLLLGMESQQSGLWCSDFVGVTEQPLVWREMVAIDRFTGGAADGAKFNVLGFEKPVLTGTLAVDLPEDNDQAKAVLGAVILGVRDLVEGMIPFGYGDMKGFGQCRGNLIDIRLSDSGAGCERLSKVIITQQEIDQIIAHFSKDALSNTSKSLTDSIDSDDEDSFGLGLEDVDTNDAAEPPAELIDKANQILNVCLEAVRDRNMCKNATLDTKAAEEEEPSDD